MATKPWGLAIAGYPPTFSNVTALASAINGSPSYVMFYHQFTGSGGVTYTATDFSTVLSNGLTPILTWEPRDNQGIIHVSNADVINGTYDTLIDSYANGLKTQAGTVFVRLAHEMNGNWYDWAPGNNGNTFTSYVQMWQHVWGRFQSAGVTNVKWIWCPNIHNNDVATYAQLYPGDQYVDQIGLDGYNFGDNSFNGWQTYHTVYDQSLNDVVAAAPNKPFGIGEIGCVESTSNHSKAVWIEDALHEIWKDSRIQYFIWYDKIGSNQDFRIDSSLSSKLAFTSALVQTTSFNRF
jgi:hypothetical protein